jgi:hypothetical protein
MGAKEAGQAFLAGVLEKLPESLRAQAKGILESPEAADFLTVVGDSTLARSDYSKNMDALKTQQTALAELETALKTQQEQNQVWYDANKGAIDDYLRIKPEYDAWKAGGGDPPPAGTTPTTPTGTGGSDMGMTEEQIKKLIADQVNGAAADVVGVSTWAAKHAVQHFQTFGEVLPVDDLVSATIQARSKGQDLTLDQMYQQRYGEKLQAKATEAHNAQIETEVQRRLGEELAKRGPGLPFPTRTDPSPLDAITTPPSDPNAHTVDAAVAHFAQLTAARG